MRLWLVATAFALTACTGGTFAGPTGSVTSAGPIVSALPTGSESITGSAPGTTPPVTSSPSTSVVSPTTRATTPTSATPSPTDTAPALVPSWLLGRDITGIATTRKVVALTFDAGANDAGVTSILATLRSGGVPATFFLTGRWNEEYPLRAKEIAASGALVGNHTVTHPHVLTLTDTQLTVQVLDAAAMIRAATGADPRPWFRFPYGERTSADVNLVNRLGYVCVSWGVDTLGWQGTSGGRSIASVHDRVLAGLRPGLIVLMHVGSNPTDGSTLDAAALPSIMGSVRARGYSFVTLAALLARPA